MQKIKQFIVLTLLAAFALSACGGSDAGATPTMSVEQIQTLAVMTYQAQLTQTALAQPTSTPVPTDTPVPVATFDIPDGSSEAPLVSPTTSSAGASACYGLTWVKDVTIPDNTSMTPGQSFTKTWLVSNSGTCDWEPGFKFNVVSGDPLGGVALTLDQTVQPGRQYELSIPMVVPSDKTGELKSTWKLSDANSNFFGDGVYVLIVVGEATPAPTETATATP
jgi:hypothetical protein